MVTPQPQYVPASESAQTILAKNLVIARIAAGLTQQELASAADIARATIAQVEAGNGDPRLSTLKALATGVGLPPAFLLFGREELRALIALSAPESHDRRRAEQTDIARMRSLLSSGLLKDRLRAGRLAANTARRAGASPGAVVCAAVLSAIEPGDGTVIGMLLGDAAAPVVADDVRLNVHSSKSS